MTEFSVGDRVVCKRESPGLNPNIRPGMTGVVCAIDELASVLDVAVEWDESIPNGHSCGGTCRYGHGWWCEGSYLDYALTEESDKEIEPPIDIAVLFA